MSKYLHIARQIQRLIREEGLRSGDSLPSERALASRLGVSYTTVRSANDYLYRQGLIDRQHGRGTFVAERARPSEPSQRLGILYVDMHEQESLALRRVTFETQRAASEAGYELLIEPMETEDLLHGKGPEMIRRQSVEGVVMYGRVRDYHVHFIEDHALPYIVLGNRPISTAVPQARIDAEGMAYQVTRDLLVAGRRPVWYDVDVTNTHYHVGQEELRGYSRAVEAFGDGVLHLCPLRPHRLVEAAEKLCRTGLQQAAIVVAGWSASLLNPALALKTQRWQDLLIVPAPTANCQGLQGSNVIQWTNTTASPHDYASLGVQSLLRVLQGEADHVQSVTVGMSCQLEVLAPEPRMTFETNYRFYTPGKVPAPAASA